MTRTDPEWIIDGLLNIIARHGAVIFMDETEAMDVEAAERWLARRLAIDTAFDELLPPPRPMG